MAHQYNHVTVGGTFDHLHVGHQTILYHAFQIGKKVSIGITTDEFHTKKKIADQIEPLAVRKKNLVDFLKKKNYFSRSILVPLKDIYGTTLSDSRIQAIVVTRETKHNATKINKERNKKNLSKLKIVVIPYMKGDDTRIVRSTRIRIGEIDRYGHNYSKLFPIHTKLVLPDSTREALRKPLGKVISGNPDSVTVRVINLLYSSQAPLTIAVGDIIANHLIKGSFIPDIAIIDNRSQRQILDGGKASRGLRNQRGTIASTVARKILHSIQTAVYHGEKKTITICGEEDLLAIPAILFAPLGSIVVYGQMNRGVIVVTVTEERKQQVKNLLLQFHFL